MPRSVITGGAGFVGSHLVDRMLQRGGEVICFDNFVTGRATNLAHVTGRPGFTLVEQDVTQPLAVEGGVDAVLHLASPASPVDYAEHPIATLEVGTVGTHNALRLAVEKRARFLMASTSEVYGDPAEHPQRETYWGNVNPVGPRSVYDEAKRAAEAYVMAYHRAHNLDTRIARIFNTYGSRMRRDDGRAVPQFVTQALAGDDVTVYGDGSQTRSLCHVDDLVSGLMLLLDSDYVMPVNLGNPHEVTIHRLAQLVIHLCDSHSDIELRPLPEDDPRRRCPDIATARRELGWAPAVKLEAGLSRTIEWWRETWPADHAARARSSPMTRA
jgi:dTDP-glucose 4,6-dehydratase